MAPVSRGAVSLANARMSDKQAQEAQEMLELQLGLRCGGCGRRIGVGIQFTSIDPRDQQPVVKLAACNREDCDYAETARDDGATLMVILEHVWLDENGVEAPATKLVNPKAKPQTPPASMPVKPSRSSELPPTA